MGDRIAMAGADGALPGDVTAASVTNGGGTVEATTAGAIEVTGAVNPAWTGWAAWRTYGNVDPATVPTWITHEGTIETDAMFVARGAVAALGQIPGKTWGSHVLHGWNHDHTYRLTLLIGNNEKTEASIQTWEPTSSTFGTVRVGSDSPSSGFVFGPSLATFYGDVSLASGADIIQRSDHAASLTIAGGVQTAPTKGGKIQLFGASLDPNPSGIVLTFGSGWYGGEVTGVPTLDINHHTTLVGRFHASGQLELVTGDLRITTPKTPATATATGAAGEVCWDADYLYVCTATDTWKRAALSTWP